MTHKFYKLLALFVFISGIVAFVLYRSASVDSRSQPSKQSVSTSSSLQHGMGFEENIPLEIKEVVDSTPSTSSVPEIREWSSDESSSDIDDQELDNAVLMDTSKSGILIRQKLSLKGQMENPYPGSIFKASSSSSSSESRQEINTLFND